MGKVGNVVGYQWKGRWVMRSVAREFHDAKTELQMEQRSRLGAAMGFAARLRDILLIGFKQVANEARMTEYNYFYKTNNDCLAWDGEHLAVDYEHLRLSEGPVAPVRFGAVEVVGEMTLAIDFEKNPEHRVSGSSDKVYVAAICATLGVAVLSLPVYRRMKRITVSLPRTWEGHEVHLYGLVQDSAGRASESVYIGGGTLEEIVEASQEEPAIDLPETPEFSSETTQGRDTVSQGDAEVPRPHQPGASSAARSPS